MSPREKKLRYVEISYDVPGVELTQFRAAIFETNTPNQALKEARKDVLIAHPDATNINEFLQRVVTPERAKDIKEQFEAGTWEGWPLGKESSDA